MKNDCKIIVHVRDMDEKHAMNYVQRVMDEGKISGDGKSYCYHTSFGDNTHVSTREPRGTTYTFYVYEEYNQ